MDTTVKLQIKISGSDSFKEVEVSADDFAKAISTVKNKAKELQNSIINSNQMVQAFEQVTSAVQGLQSVMHGLTDAYGVQVQAEARLEQVMRNTMDATDDEIQSIKDLTAAQQELGIVGDEVQLSAAQELATYLEKKDSLEKLIPVMNDMIAQQLGYNATAESAVPIATMMGKVMEGQVKALSRYGYSFSEAQEEILKFGTEEERAATLAEVVEQSVGGVNAAMAATPYGKIVQANNKMGDLKETIGAMIAPAQTVVDKVASFSIALAGIGKGISTLKALDATLKSTALSANLTATAQRMLGAAGISAAAGTTALKVAVVGLQAALTMGLSVAITAIVALITRLADKSRDATSATEKLAEADRQANEQYTEQAGRVRALTAIVENNNIALEQRKKALEELKSIVPDYHGELTEEGRLIKSNKLAIDDYCRSLREQIRLQAHRDQLMQLEQKIVDKENELAAAKDRQGQALLKAGGDATESYSTLGGVKFTDYGKASGEVRVIQKDLDNLYAQEKEIAGEMESLTGKTIDSGKRGMTEQEKAIMGVESKYNELFDRLEWQYAGNAKKQEEERKRLESEQQKEIAAINEKYKATEQGAEWERMSYAQLGDAIKEQKKKVGELADATSDAAQRETATLAAMQKRHYELGVQLGLETESTKGTTKETVTLGNELNNLKEINAKIAELEKQRLEASKDEIKAIDTQIDRVKRLKAEFEGLPTESNLIPQLKPVTPGKPLWPDALPQREDTSPYGFTSSKQFSDRIAKLNEDLDLAPKSQRQAIEEEIALVQRLKDEFEGVNQTVAASPMETFAKGWGGIKGIGNSIRDIKDALTDTDNAWDALTQTVDGFISMFQSLQAVVEIIKGITAATEALGIAKKVETEITKEDATAKMADAAAGAASSVASTPVVGAILAVAAIGSVIAALTSLPKFANGGLVYGPTVGLMGEYGGASSNPEVIAPLSRLRSILGADQGGRTEVKFRIAGRELVGIMNKQNNIYTRSK